MGMCHLFVLANFFAAHEAGRMSVECFHLDDLGCGNRFVVGKVCLC